MRRELLDLAAALARKGEPFVLATVVARTPPISAQVGDVALVTRDGGFHGWVGGSCTRPTVIAEALKALDDSRPRLVALDPDPESRRRPGLMVYPMTCHSGGSVEIHIQPVLPPPRLVVFGLSPTARALVRLGKAMGYAVSLIDPAAEAADFPEADAVFTDPNALASTSKSTSTSASASATVARVPSVATFAVVATQGQWDEEATAAALALRPDYLGVMASSKRFGEMSALLTESADAAGAAALGRIKNPAGFDLGAQLPEEIALSILAEIVEKRRAAARRPDSHGAHVGGSHAEAHPSVVPHARAATEERDPVCGMMVAVAGAAHTAEHVGRMYYFCCGGCRQRFLATPDRYLSAPATAAAPAPVVDGGPHVGATIRVKR